MRHTILLGILAQFATITLTAQSNNRLNSYDYVLEVNNIKVSLDPIGTIGYSNYNPYYFNVPADGEASAISGGFFWLGGIDQFGETRTFTPDYYGLESEVHFGPYNNKTATLSAPELEVLYIPYSRVWLVSAAEITAHKLQYNTPDYMIPESILNWPGNGDTTNGFNAQLAPYVDVNNNFIYEPMEGDYPLIKGDAAVFAMYHDNSLYEIYPYDKNMDIEVHVLMYAFEAAPETFLDNTLFVDYTFYNRGDFSFDTLYGGSFVDFKIGCYTDDYCGSDSTLNLFYGYNGDLEDGPWDITYTTLPALGCVPLTHPLHAFMYLTGDASVTGYPDNSEEVLFSLDAKFGDGVPMTTGGIGYNTGSTSFTNYMFHGDVNNFEQWTEITESDAPGDRRGIGSISIGGFDSGETGCASFAYIFADAGTSISKTASVDLLKIRTSEVTTYYNESNLIGCGERVYIPLALNTLEQENLFSLYPNPTDDIIYVSTNFDAGAMYSITVYNAAGVGILNQRFSNGIDNEVKNISVENLAEGMYWIVIAKDGSYDVQAVIVQ